MGLSAAAALAAQGGQLGDWLLPAGAAVGAATALLIRARRARRTSAGDDRTSRRHGAG